MWTEGVPEINAMEDCHVQRDYWVQWRSQRGGLGGSNPPIRIEAVFFTAVKLLLLNIITSL